MIIYPKFSPKVNLVKVSSASRLKCLINLNLGYTIVYISYNFGLTVGFMTDGFTSLWKGKHVN